jgi:hypothetical protein
MFFIMFIMPLAECDHQQLDSIGHHHHPHVGIFNSNTCIIVELYTII